MKQREIVIEANNAIDYEQKIKESKRTNTNRQNTIGIRKML